MVLPWLQEIELERSGGPEENPWIGFGSVELCWALGDRIEDESSLLHWVAKHRIPMVIPGLTDFIANFLNGSVEVRPQLELD